MPSIKKEEILKAIDYAENNGVFDKLNKIYSTLPSGKCEGCAKCCMESVGTSLVEFLNIYRYFREKPEIYKRYMEKVLEYYFMEYRDKRSCPFLDEDNRCSIYEVRPLNCRIFGHWEKDEYNMNLDSIKEKNRDYRDLMKSRYGFEISEDVVEYRINYCEKFKPDTGRYLSREERLDFSDQIMILDSKIFATDTIDIDYRDRGIVEYFIDSMFNTETSYNIKIRMSQDWEKADTVLKRLKIITGNYRRKKRGDE